MEANVSHATMIWIVICIVTSDLVLFSQSVNLPSFTQTPVDTTIREGSQTYSYLRCSASGFPPPRIRFWMKNGIRVTENTGQFVTLSDGSLRIHQPQRTMEGYYQCVAQSSFWSVISKRAKLSVAYFGFIALVTETKRISAGNTLILSQSSSVPCGPKERCIFTWKKSNQILSETNRISISKENVLYITNVEASDQGIYSCELTNTFLAGLPVANVITTKTTIKRTTLSVSGSRRYYAPSIVHPPQPFTAIQGKVSEAKFECFIGKSQPGSTIVIWKKDGVTIRAGGKYSFDVNSKRLKIRSPMKIDEGRYNCEATYSIYPKVYSGSAKLDVIVPPSFQKQPAIRTAFTDNSTRLWCNVTTAYPTYTTTWYINAVKVVPDGKSYIFNSVDRSLNITRLSWRHAGGYQCFAENAGGQAISTGTLLVSNITVQIIKAPPSQVHEPIGKTTILPCVAQGAPLPTITWYRNGQKIPTNVAYFTQRSNGYLQITNPRSQESGTYTCVAKNAVGQASAVSTVLFLIATQITRGPNGTTKVELGRRHTIPCEVNYDRRITIRREWRKNTLESNIRTNSRFVVKSDGSLELRDIHSTDEGTFSCHVFSKGGNVSASTTLVIVSIPLVPSTPRASEIGAYSLRLTWWAPGGDGGSAIIAYILEMKNETQSFFHLITKSIPGAMPTLLIQPLAAGKRFKFRVAAKNAIGRSRFSDETPFITTLTLAPSAAPSNIYAERSTQDTITLTWTPPSILKQNGDLQGYYIYYRLEGYTNSQFTELRVPDGSLTRYTMTSLPTYTKYKIKMAAYNSAGTGVVSGAIDAETRSGVPTIAPSNLAVSVKNASAVSVAFDPPPQVSWNGRLDGVKAFAWFPGRPQTQVTRIAPFDSSKPRRQAVIFTNLKPYTEYALSIAVYTASGDSPASSVVQFKTQEGKPGTPRDIMISGIYANAFTVSWKPPLQTSGILQGYGVSYKAKNNDIYWTTFREPSFSRGAVIRNLQPNNQYELKVYAFTNAGNGSEVIVSAYTNNAQPTPPARPSKPILYLNNSTSITLGWNPGQSGSVPLYYIIEFQNETNYIWDTAMNLTRIQDIPARIPFLRPNTAYRFRVTAYNALGRSPTSNISAPITTTGAAPLAGVTYLTASPYGRQTLRIEWIPPLKESWGTPSIRYIIILRPVSRFGVESKITHPDSQARSYTHRGLAKWTEYNITVTVSNDKGVGPLGQSVLARTSEDVPDNGPANIVPVAVNSSAVNVTWGIVPMPIRHGIIKGYKIKYNIKGRPTTAENMTIAKNTTFAAILTGLAGYEEYEIRMNAKTKSGESKFTDPETVRTHAGVPGKPYKVRFPVVGLDMVQVTWQPPLRPNGIINGYDIRYKINRGNTRWIRVLGQFGMNARSADVGGLSANVYYLFKVQARSSQHGLGEAAEELVLTTNKRETPEGPVILPIPPSDVQSTSVLVKWVAGADGKSPIRTFSLQYNRESEGWKDYMWKPATYEIPPSITQIKVLRLSPARNYVFRVKATNDIGDSAWSDTSNNVRTNPDAPNGAPTHVVIKGDRPNSLLVQWRAPSYEDLNGILTEFLLKYRKQGASGGYNEIILPKETLQKRIQNLEVFTAYEILLAAKNIRGTGPWTPVYVRKTGEKVPSSAPYNIEVTVSSSSAIQVKWTAPPANSVNGYLLGFKIEYFRPNGKRRRRAVDNFISKNYQFTNDMMDYFGLSTVHRQRRAVPSYCITHQGPALQVKVVGPDKNRADVRGLKMFTRYLVSVKMFNSKGDGPKSVTKDIHTPEGLAGSPHIVWFRSYTDVVDINWNEPCDRNGIIRQYQLVYKEINGGPHPTRYYSASDHFLRVGGLKKDTEYLFALSARTNRGFGNAAKLRLRTKITAYAPGKPGRPSVFQAKKDYAVLRWKEGDPGNTPITKYIIQYRSSFSKQWKQGWKPSEYSLTRNGTLMAFTVKDLKSKEQYMFRLIAVNRIGSSPPSDSSIIIRAGERIAQENPFYEEIWFIVLMVVVGILIIAVIIVVCCIRRRSRSPKYKPAEVTANHNQPGYSSFEMAMVRRESEQQLLNHSESGSAHQSTRSLASQASKSSKKTRLTNDKLSTKNDKIDEVSVSSMSKHSDVSDNDADKSADETDDEKKRGGRSEPTDASIASHYANDPFYKSWRHSLDKKTRKAILTEYHKKANRDEEVSSDSISGQRRMPRATSEERLDRSKVRPGRYDLSEKRKLAQSDPNLPLPQDFEPSPASVSSFSPKDQHRRMPRGRPGKKEIDRSIARSEPSLAARGSESDSDTRFPPPYDSNGLRKSHRKNSFLRATHDDDEPEVQRSREDLMNEKSKRQLIEELDKKVDDYTGYPPPYEDDSYLANEDDGRPPPAYTPRKDNRQDSSDEGRPHVGYNGNQRHWRPKRSEEDRSSRYRSSELMEPRMVPDEQVDGYEFDYFDAPSRTSMTLV